MQYEDNHDTELADISLFKDPSRHPAGLLDKARRLHGTLLPRVLPITTLSMRALSPRSSRFEIHRLRNGSRHGVIVVNGLGSLGDMETSDWQTALEPGFGQSAWYHVDWEACRSPSKYLKDRVWSGLAADVDLLWAWHGAMSAAERAGKLLAQALIRTHGWRFTLAGHSLGGRVIHYALQALAASPYQRIDDVYLLGAAVGGGKKDDRCWKDAAKAVDGRIFNCYSEGDAVLSLLYRGANAGLSQPAGHSGIRLEHERIANMECNDLINGYLGHLDWKQHFGTILARTGKH